MFALAKVVNWLILVVAALLYIPAYESPWVFIVMGLLIAVATPIDYILAKKLLLDKSIAVKASARNFARRFMANAIYWSVIGLTVLVHGITQMISANLNKGPDSLVGWVPYIPVIIFIIGWAVAGKFRFDPDKFDKGEAKKA